MNISSKLIQAINSYLAGKASLHEKKQVDDWYHSFDDEADVELQEKINSNKEEIERRLRERIRKSMEHPEQRKKTQLHAYFRTIGAAATVLLLLSGGIYVYKQNRQPENEILPKLVSADVAPGGNKAFLTLADGSKIALNDAANGRIASQAGIVITKTAEGQLVYTVSNTKYETESTKTVFNVIETPKGGQYQVDLPDGTKVWLNAASSLRYPTAFNGSKRQVELSGEAYFEVSRNKAMPFLIVSHDQTVEVLGTHFNINAYNDEPSTNTTLLEGSVAVSSHTNTDTKILKPGQESLVNGAATSIMVKEADTESAVAWKNGYFQFNNTDINTIMRQIERWYDVRVSLPERIPGKHFTGTITRDTNISKVLHMLELTSSVRFEVKGKEVILLR